MPARTSLILALLSLALLPNNGAEEHAEPVPSGGGEADAYAAWVRRERAGARTEGESWSSKLGRHVAWQEL